MKKKLIKKYIKSYINLKESYVDLKDLNLYIDFHKKLEINITDKMIYSYINQIHKENNEKTRFKDSNRRRTRSI